MKLKKLLEGLEYTVTAGNSSQVVDPENVEIKNVVNDNRKIEEGSLFICIKGANFDGHSVSGEAAEKKAGAIVVTDHLGISHDQFSGGGSEAAGIRFCIMDNLFHPAVRFIETEDLPLRIAKDRTLGQLDDLRRGDAMKVHGNGCESILLGILINTSVQRKDPEPLSAVAKE